MPADWYDLPEDTLYGDPWDQLREPERFVTDDEFGISMDPCEHPSINGGVCAVCGFETDNAPPRPPAQSDTGVAAPTSATPAPPEVSTRPGTSGGTPRPCLMCGAPTTDRDWRTEGGRLCGECSGVHTCRDCGKWLPPWNGAVPASEADAYCWRGPHA